MTEDNLDRLTEMLRIIQQNEPKPEPDSAPRYEFRDSGKKRFEFGDTGKTREEIRAEVDREESAAKADPSYDFTLKVIDEALIEMLPYIVSNESPFDSVMVKQLGLNAFVLKRHLADLLVKALKTLPEDVSQSFIKEIKNGQVLMSMLAFAATEMVLIVAKTHELAQGIDGHPLNGK